MNEKVGTWFSARALASGASQLALGLFIVGDGSAHGDRGEAPVGLAVVVAGLICYLLGQGMRNGRRWVRPALLPLCALGAGLWGLGSVAAFATFDPRHDPLLAVVLLPLAAFSCATTLFTAWGWRAGTAMMPTKERPRAVLTPRLRSKPPRLPQLKALQAEHRYLEITGAAAGDAVHVIHEKGLARQAQYDSTADHGAAVEIINDALSHLNSRKKKTHYDLCRRKMDAAASRAGEIFRRLVGAGQPFPEEHAKVVREDAWRSCWPLLSKYPSRSPKELEALANQEADAVVARYEKMLREAIASRRG